MLGSVFVGPLRFWLGPAARLVTSFVVLSGCAQDVCEPGDERCVNGKTQICALTGDNCNSGDAICDGATTPAWIPGATCAAGTACVVAGGHAICSLTPAPLPACARANSVCFQNSVATCTAGYPVLWAACPGKTCKAEPAGAVANGTAASSPGDPTLACAYCSDGTETPDPSCAAGSFEVCGDGGIYSCSCGDRAALSEDCSVEGAHCVAVNDRGMPVVDAALNTFCALSNQVDPACGDPTLSSNLYCGADGLYASCMFGYDVPPLTAPESCR
jgi:hypothetical protein